MKSTFFQQSTMRDWFSKTTTIIILLLIFQIPRIDVIFDAKFQTRYGHTLFKIMPLVFVQRAKTLGEFQRSA